MPLNWGIFLRTPRDGRQLKPVRGLTVFQPDNYVSKNYEQLALNLPPFFVYKGTRFMGLKKFSKNY